MLSVMNWVPFAMEQQQNSTNTFLTQFFFFNCTVLAHESERYGTVTALLVQRSWGESKETQGHPHTSAFTGDQGTETSLLPYHWPAVLNGSLPLAIALLQSMGMSLWSLTL